MTSLRRWALGLGLLFAVCAAVVIVARSLNDKSFDATQPRPIVWNEEQCSECKMQIGERAFAAQLITDQGDAQNFDDPGCLLRKLEREKPKTRAIYFHHLRESRWLKAPAVAFITVPNSPMGHNLAAVDAGTAGALSFAEARARVRATDPAQYGSVP
jgi:hypothetical protein